MRMIRIARAALSAAAVAAAPLAAAETSFEGGYIGGSIGHSWRDSTWTTTCTGVNDGVNLLYCNTDSPRLPQGNPADIDAQGAQFGLLAGYDMRLGGNWVGGIEADLNWADAEASIGNFPGTWFPGDNPAAIARNLVSVTTDWGGSLRLRLGIVTGDTLIYGTGGAAFQHVEMFGRCGAADMVTPFCGNRPNADSATETRWGWTLGAGVETVIAADWTARVEYRYADFGDMSYTHAAGTINEIGAEASVATSVVTLGIVYRFGK